MGLREKVKHRIPLTCVYERVLFSLKTVRSIEVVLGSAEWPHSREELTVCNKEVTRRLLTSTHFDATLLLRLHPS